MKKLIFHILALLVFAASALALEPPALSGRVNDLAGMLSPAVREQLEQQLAGLEKSDSTQLVVLTIPSLAGENIEDFSIRVAEKWKIGQKGLDNGAILLISKAERRIRIEVGRGLEGKLTDLISGRIIRSDIAPKFKSGDFDGGVTAGITSIIAVVKGEYTAPLNHDLNKGAKGKGYPPLPTLLIFLAVAMVFASSWSRYFAGIVGAIGLPIIGWLTFPGLATILLFALCAGGFLLGLLLALIFGGGGGGGGYFGGPFFGGGYYGGGGGSDGDSGFSGGGGDFGGGGASDDW